MTPENWNALAGAVITFLGILLTLAARRIQQTSVVKRDIESFQKSNKTLRDELDIVQSQLDDKTRGSQERDRRIDSLAEEVRLTASTAREVERTNANLQGRLTEQREIFTRQLSDQTGQIIQLTITLDQRNDELKELKQSQSTREAADKETIARLEAELITERTERQALADRVLTLEKQVKLMLEERAQLIKERDEAIAERDAALAQVAVLLSEKAQADSDRVDWKVQVDKLVEDLATANEQIRVQNATIVVLPKPESPAESGRKPGER